MLPTLDATISKNVTWHSDAPSSDHNKGRRGGQEGRAKEGEGRDAFNESNSPSAGAANVNGMCFHNICVLQ